MNKKIQDVQKKLKEQHLDGWLLYDFRKSNALAIDFLEFPCDPLLSRRFFYFIPAQGEPVKIVHRIEPNVLDHLPGIKSTYLSWESLEDALRDLLKKIKTVAMEYSPRNAIPYVSRVDGGTLELIKAMGCEVHSSAMLLQYYSSTLSEQQQKSHEDAAEFLDQLVPIVWTFIAEKLQNNLTVSEFSVQQFILKNFKEAGYITGHAPICCVNAHTADPHFNLTEKTSHPIRKGDFILIDLWCKKNSEKAIFADITRVAIASSSIPEKINHVFNIVRNAQLAAIEYVKECRKQKKDILGCDVDGVARRVIRDSGFEAFFTHRTGHNIHTELHGPGAHLDSLETHDTRLLLPQTCYSVEPGIYLPGEFGVRLESDILITSSGELKVTGGLQSELYQF